jgi:hypothetical protein
LADLAFDAFKKPIPEVRQPRVYRIPLPVRVVVVEEQADISAYRGRKVVGEEVADPVHELLAVR